MCFWSMVLTDAGRLADWLAAAQRGGRGSGLLRNISEAHWVARRLRTNFFKIHFKLSEVVVVSQHTTSVFSNIHKN